MTADAVAESKITVPELPTAFVSREHLLERLERLERLAFVARTPAVAP
jgi:hypothetical protein